MFVPETQLVDGTCPTCGSTVERLKEESYFFRLSKYQQPLLDYYATIRTSSSRSSGCNEMRTFVEAGLQDLSVSRTSFKWGIPVPDDPEHVMYVWFDALTNYLTALGFGSGTPEAEARIAKYWPAVTHLDRQGDRPPARALLAGVPDVRGPAAAAPHRRSRLVADGRREDVEVARQRRALPGLHRALRRSTRCATSSMREMVLGQDANFSDEAILTRFNADLANDLGNLVSRATTMVQRYCDGVVPGVAAGRPRRARPRSRGARSTRRSTRVEGELRRVSDQPGAAGHVGAVRHVNKYIVEREPWELAKEPTSAADAGRRRCITPPTRCASSPRSSIR